MSRAFDGTPYYPGVVGLNNIKANDYENVVLHVITQLLVLTYNANEAFTFFEKFCCPEM